MFSHTGLLWRTFEKINFNGNGCCLFFYSCVGLGGNHGFLTDAGQNGAEDIPALCDGLFDFSSDFAVGKLQVVACVASVVHQGEETIIDVQKLDGKTKHKSKA